MAAKLDWRLLETKLGPSMELLLVFFPWHSLSIFKPVDFSLLIYSRTNWLGGKLYRRLSSLTLTRNIIKIKFFSKGLSEGRSPFYIYIISYCRFATTAIIILCVSCFCCVDRVYIFKEMSPPSPTSQGYNLPKYNKQEINYHVITPNCLRCRYNQN